MGVKDRKPPALQPVVHPGKSTVFIIADDLTGACDAASPFAMRRMCTRVALDPEWLPQSEVLALDIGSRDVTVEAARIRIRAALEVAHHRKPHLLLKKIDSVFRGNTVEEVKTCLNLLPHKFAILAPGYPPLGRRVRDGRLHVCHLAGQSTLDIASQLSDYDIKFRTLKLASMTNSTPLAERMIRAKEDGLRLVLCDTETEQDLDEIVHAGLHSSLDLIWMGSAGLAHALAKTQASHPEEATWPPVEIRGAIIFCIGSDHPVTLEQIRNLKQTRDPAELFLDSETGNDIDVALKKGLDILLHVDPKRRQHGQSYLLRMCEVLHPNIRRSIGALLLSGGDTAAMVCNAFKAQGIELRNELLPGIPSGLIRGGAADGLAVITKSGGFGAEDALLQIANRFREERNT
jgi:uncharacterized protein YgbK (DUF1537 family)